MMYKIKTQYSKIDRIYVYLVASLFLVVLLTTQGNAQETKKKPDLFVHPFFAHMALADEPGTASFRFTGFQRRSGDRLTDDAALHIEAGLVKNLGIHIRTDAIRKEEYSEVMLMYNVLTTGHEKYGVSVFGQVSLPTGYAESNEAWGLFGLGIKATPVPFVVFNGDIHYDPSHRMSEYEGSFVAATKSMLYPIMEFRGEITTGGTSLYLLPGLKFRIAENQTIGAAYQFGTSGPTEYNVEGLIQYGIEF